jgi:hypothetical protein
MATSEKNERPLRAAPRQQHEPNTNGGGQTENIFFLFLCRVAGSVL